MKKQAKISKLPTSKTKNYKHYSEGYAPTNHGEFAFSDNIEKWMHGKAKPTKNAKPLF